MYVIKNKSCQTTVSQIKRNFTVVSNIIYIYTYIHTHLIYIIYIIYGSNSHECKASIKKQKSYLYFLQKTVTFLEVTGF